MDVGMMGQRLSLGMQNRDQADPGAEAFGKDGQRVRRSAATRSNDMAKGRRTPCLDNRRLKRDPQVVVKNRNRRFVDDLPAV
jgi:hypothetical protein